MVLSFNLEKIAVAENGVGNKHPVCVSLLHYFWGDKCVKLMEVLFIDA